MDLKGVLVVDDYLSLREILKIFFEINFKCNFHEAEGGLAGWEKALKVKPELILTDVKMKGGDGLELLKRIRESKIFPDTKIVVMSGSEDAGFQKRAYQGGADFFLAKPFDFNFLKALISKLMI